MSSSNTNQGSANQGNSQGSKQGPFFSAPVSVLRYQDIAALPVAEVKAGPTELEIEHEKQQISVLTLPQREQLIAESRAAGAAEREGQIRADYQQRFEAEAARIVVAIATFHRERQDYFSRVESEVVKLALAIASKILHREAQMDPMLLASLVKIAVNQLHDGSKVSVRIRPGDAPRWREYFKNPRNGTVVDVIEDANLTAKDCVLETDLGSANFSIDGQLKEVEQGFFDLLSLRPGK